MTWEQIVALAQRRGIVRWLPSDRIERLRLDRSGRIMAGRFTAGGVVEHRLYPIPSRTEYYCYEIDPNQWVSLGSLLK